MATRFSLSLSLFPLLPFAFTRSLYTFPGWVVFVPLADDKGPKGEGEREYVDLRYSLSQD